MSRPIAGVRQRGVSREAVTTGVKQRQTDSSFLVEGGVSLGHLSTPTDGDAHSGHTYSPFTICSAGLLLLPFG